MTGVDFAKVAIERASVRTQGKRSRVDFCVGALNALAFPLQSFDVAVAFDSLYFADDLKAVRRKPGHRPLTHSRIAESTFCLKRMDAGRMKRYLYVARPGTQ